MMISFKRCLKELKISEGFKILDGQKSEFFVEIYQKSAFCRLKENQTKTLFFFNFTQLDNANKKNKLKLTQKQKAVKVPFKTLCLTF